MGYVNTNDIGFGYTEESALGTPGTTWKTVQPNAVSKITPDTKAVARMPISPDRLRRKGTVVDRDGGFAFEADATLDAFIDLIPGYLNSLLKNTAPFSPTSVTSSGYVVASGGAIADGYLINAQGFAIAGNNGVKVLAGTSTGVLIKASGLAAETVAATRNATVEVCGIRCAADDIAVASGVITSVVLDFTTLPIQVGQVIGFGGDTGHKFANAANRGYMRVTSIAAHALGVDRMTTALVNETTTSITLDLYFGRWGRPVARSSGDFAQKSYTFESLMENLGASPGDDQYVYSKGCTPDTLELTLPLTGKATLKAEYKGTTTDDPTTSRLSGASTPLAAVKEVLIGTATDIARLRILTSAGVAISTSAWFKALTLKLTNNVNAQKFLANLGAQAMSLGYFEIDLDIEGLLTSEVLLAAIRANTTIGADIVLRTSDGAIVFDIPSMTAGGGALNLPVNELVTVKATGMPFKDATFGYDMSVSFFPYAPAY